MITLEVEACAPASRTRRGINHVSVSTTSSTRAATATARAGRRRSGRTGTGRGEVGTQTTQPTTPERQAHAHSAQSWCKGRRRGKRKPQRRRGHSTRHASRRSLAPGGVPLHGFQSPSEIFPDPPKVRELGVISKLMPSRKNERSQTRSTPGNRCQKRSAERFAAEPW